MRLNIGGFSPKVSAFLQEYVNIVCRAGLGSGGEAGVWMESG
jgi:hypothetical protein